MVWLIYNLLFTLALMATLPYYFFRMGRRGGYRRGFGQRLGWYDKELRRKVAERHRIWVHAVSVGEVSVAQRFMDAWRQEHPDTAFVLSTTTSTAYALAGRSLNSEDVLVYFPVDFPPVLRAVISIIRPQMLVLTEGEWWPNLIRMIRSRAIPILLINGRMSQNSFRGYRRVRWFFSRVLRMVDLICVQSRQDADRLLNLGADPKSVHVTGSAKYDAAKQDPDSMRKALEILKAAGLAPADTFLLGGSTWPGEETILLEAYLRFKPVYPELHLILVPRHAERRNEVMSEVLSRGLRVVQRSRMEGAAPPVEPPDVLLIDTIGELKHLFAVASVIFMGKSLTTHGGQNIIEPAAYRKPIVIGPYNENFTEVVSDFLSAGAVIQVQDSLALFDRLDQLLANRTMQLQYGDRAASLVEGKRGSLEKTLGLAAGIQNSPPRA
jgi:3-deoxy-D-manno-octulosonic-acid transferase